MFLPFLQRSLPYPIDQKCIHSKHNILSNIAKHFYKTIAQSCNNWASKKSWKIPNFIEYNNFLGKKEPNIAGAPLFILLMFIYSGKATQFSQILPLWIRQTRIPA